MYRILKCALCSTDLMNSHFRHCQTSWSPTQAHGWYGLGSTKQKSTFTFTIFLRPDRAWRYKLKYTAKIRSNNNSRGCYWSVSKNIFKIRLKNCTCVVPFCIENLQLNLMFSIMIWIDHQNATSRWGRWSSRSPSHWGTAGSWLPSTQEGRENSVAVKWSPSVSGAGLKIAPKYVVIWDLKVCWKAQGGGRLLCYSGWVVGIP